MSDIFLNVYLFSIVFCFFIWLITPEKAESNVHVQFENFKDVKEDINQENLEKEVLKLKVNSVRKLAQKLKIKRYSGKRTLKKDEIVGKIIEFLSIKPEKVKIALMELEIEKIYD